MRNLNIDPATQGELAAKADNLEAKKITNNTFKQGDILYSSWGYDQINIDFYKVIKISKTMVTVISIGKVYLEKENEYEDMVYPDLLSQNAHQKSFRRKIKTFNNILYVNITDYETAKLWDNEPKAQTDPRCGH